MFCRGVVLLCVLPPFEGWDEYQHIGYILYLTENDNRPCFGQADVPASLMARTAGLPALSLEPCDSSAAWVPSTTARTGSSARGQAANRRRWRAARIGLYQAQHGPLYYRLVRPLFEALGGVADLKRSIAGLRLVNLILTTATVWLAARGRRAPCPGPLAGGVLRDRDRDPAVVPDQRGSRGQRRPRRLPGDGVDRLGSQSLATSPVGLVVGAGDYGRPSGAGQVGAFWLDPIHRRVLAADLLGRV